MMISKKERFGAGASNSMKNPTTQKDAYPIGPKKPWYRSTPFYVILLFVFWQLGAFLILTDMDAPRLLKGIALAMIAIFLVSLCALTPAFLYTFGLL